MTTITRSTENRKDLGASILAARLRADLTQGELAARIGSSQQSVAKWEASISTPRASRMNAVIAVLGPLDGESAKPITSTIETCPIGFPERLRAARTRNNLTLAALADKIDISPQAIHKWETGDSVPSYHHLHAVTTLLGMNAPAAAPAAPAALHELLLAELIINTLQNVLTDEQRQLVGAQLAAAGLQGSTPIRYFERRAAITAAGENYLQPRLA